MDFEDFEGFKKIQNKKNLSLQEIFELLDQYEENIGKLLYNDDIEKSEILIDIEGKYNTKIYLKNNEIIIERIIEDGFVDDSLNSFENGKSIPLAHADRVIEQIYDLINDYIDDGIINEPITKVQKVLKLSQQEKVNALKAIPISDCFIVTEYENEKNVLYTIKQSILTKSYIARNVAAKREIFNIGYERESSQKFIISKPPFEIINIYKDETSVKIVLKGMLKNKELKISADYSDNHYLIEHNEVVIGAIDCLDSLLKRNYRLEINDLKFEDIIIAVAIITDYISHVEGKGV